MASDKKKKGKGKGKGAFRPKVLLAIFLVVFVGLMVMFTIKTGVLPFEGGQFGKFITFQWF